MTFVSGDLAGSGAPEVVADGSTSWHDILSSLVAGEDLTAGWTHWALSEVMSGRADDARLAGLLIGLRAKGESVDEIAGLAQALVAHAVPLPIPGPVLDIVGTGGDGSGSVNISSGAAVVAAAAGVRVVKHGNRAASSRCGSADVLEALGVRIDLAPSRVAEVVGEVGVTFAFAQTFHPAMRHAAGVRRALGVRTAFNVLGPLINPARPAAMAVGVSDLRWAPVVAGVLARNAVSALVFRGDDGVDELTTTGGADVWVVAGGDVALGRFEPGELNLPAATMADLAGGDAVENAARLREVLAGRPGPLSDTIAVNAAAGLVAMDIAADAAANASPTASDIAADLTSVLKGHLVRTCDAIAGGAAEDLLKRWVAATGR